MHVTAPELTADVERRLAVERALCQLVDQAVDVTSHIASRLVGRSAQTQRESFDLAAQAGVLDHELARALQPSVGLRSLLVHGDADIDLAVVASSVGVAVRDDGAYVRAVSAALLAQGSGASG